MQLQVAVYCTKPTLLNESELFTNAVNKFLYFCDTNSFNMFSIPCLTSLSKIHNLSRLMSCWLRRVSLSSQCNAAKSFANLQNGVLCLAIIFIPFKPNVMFIRFLLIILGQFRSVISQLIKPIKIFQIFLLDVDNLSFESFLV